MRVQLQHLAHTRSGDKGNTSNIAVFAYEPEFYELLRAQLTAERFKAFHRDAIKGKVIRYEVEAIHALNFVAHGALGGGVSRSLCLDNYGKALSSAILGFTVEVPDSMRAKLRGLSTVQNI
ncbi:hypothetical protein VRY85_06545 [Achromobacter sp. F4_2707]|uniref:AtuA-related protein n=1 Tax=Achromobacter sp. F4_2707 TaxID=3114286 RepID=UPI0039C6EA8D